MTSNRNYFIIGTLGITGLIWAQDHIYLNIWHLDVDSVEFLGSSL